MPCCSRCDRTFDWNAFQQRSGSLLGCYIKRTWFESSDDRSDVMVSCGNVWSHIEKWTYCRRTCMGFRKTWSVRSRIYSMRICFLGIVCSGNRIWV